MSGHSKAQTNTQAHRQYQNITFRHTWTANELQTKGKFLDTNDLVTTYPATCHVLSAMRRADVKHIKLTL